MRLITIHMYLAVFFAPAVLLVAFSGGLYLTGVKGEVERETVFTSRDDTIDPESESLHADVAALLAKAGAGAYRFEYVKVSGDNLITRPTSEDHYIIKLGEGGVEVIDARPDLQGKMIELHKGHGPGIFKLYQKVFAVGLVFIILSGLLLGLSSARLRRSSLLTVFAGTVIFILAIL